MKKYAGKPYLIKEINKNLIKQIIKEKGPVSKPEIAKFAKLSLPTVNKAVDKLVEEEYVKLSGVGDSAVGRRPNLYEINGEAGHVLALFFENDYIKAAESNLVGEILEEDKIKIDLKSRDTALGSTFDIIDALFYNSPHIKAIGIGVPGVVKADGSIFNIPNITEWEGINLKSIIEARYHVPVFIENDVNLTTVGVFNRDLKRKYSNIVYIYFGKGVGSGIIINKRLYKGISNFAGEIGYMITQDVDSKLLDQVKTKGLTEQITSDIIKDFTEDKASQTKKLIKEVANIIINITCIINPEVVVMKGDFISREFISAVKKYICSYIDKRNSPKLIILDDDNAGLVGTINLCISGINPNYLLVDGKGV